MGTHHVASAPVVDLARHGRSGLGYRPGKRVEHPVAVGAHIEHGGGPVGPHQVSGVVGLAAAGGVEGGAVQFDAAVVDGYDGGVEGPQVGVVQVEAVGHGLSPRSPPER